MSSDGTRESEQAAGQTMTTDGRAVHDVDLRLALSAHAPGEARDRTGSWLDAVGVHPDLRRDVLIAVSELVTNAVTHAASAPRVLLTADGRHLRIEVRDDSADPPIRREGTSAGGFGVRLVGELAVRWGWTPIAGGGKAVWAEIDTDRTRTARGDAADGGQ